jgi:hypothetical protein
MDSSTFVSKIYSTPRLIMRMFFATFVLLVTGCAPRPGSSPSAPVTVASIESSPTGIMGQLGIPLGTVAEIEASVVTIPDLPVSGPGVGRSYGLRVEKINRNAVSTPVVLRFEVRGTLMVRVAPHDVALERLLRRLPLRGEFNAVDSAALEVRDAIPLSPAEVDALQQTYIGSKHKLLVYEDAKLQGAPAKLPEEFGWLFPTGSYRFNSFLAVFAER